MSISSRIEAMEGHIKDIYDTLEIAGTDTTSLDKNIVNINSSLQDRLIDFMNNGTDQVWNNWDKVTGEGSNVSLSPTIPVRMGIIPKGACEQDGTPTPDNHIPVKVVTGDNSVVVHSQNLLDISKKYTGGTPDSEDYLTNSHTGTSSDYYMDIWFNKGGLLKPNTDYLLVIEVAEITRTTIITINDNNAQSPFTSSGSLQKSLSANNTYVIPVKTKSNITNTYDLRAYFYLLANVSLSYKLRFSIIEDLTTTAQTFVYRPFGMQTYTLHLGTNYLAGIGTYKDEIVGKTDNWKIKRYVGKMVFNGTQTWSSTTDSYYYALNDALGTNSARPKSNRFIYGGSGGNYGTFRFGNTNQNLIFNKTREEFSTISSWNEYLTTDNVIVYYELATPVEIPITDTTPISDLNNMYQAMGYDGTTNITITSNSANAQMTASISALKKLI